MYCYDEWNNTKNYEEFFLKGVSKEGRTYTCTDYSTGGQTENNITDGGFR